jgi:alpha-tubulin suppressor-like RCC1 family protein
MSALSFCSLLSSDWPDAQEIGILEVPDPSTASDHLPFLLRSGHLRVVLPGGAQARSVSAGALHFCIVSDLGGVYTFGVGRDGQLGHGAYEDCLHPRLVEGALVGKQPAVQVASGGFHNLCLLECGSVYSWGCGKDGRLGRGSTESTAEPGLVVGLQGQHVVQVACGEAHSAAITKEGRLYVWGSSNDGQVGIRGARGSYSSPMKIDAVVGVRVMEVACGARHTMALTDGGQVLSWGRGGHGRLGHGGAACEDAPRHVEGLRGVDVVHIAAGGMHSAAVSVDGLLYTWGHAAHGQLGHGENGFPEHTPRPVLALRGCKVTRVACGAAHTTCVTADARVFRWGRVLGAVEGASTPLEVPEVAVGHPISDVACSSTSTIVVVGNHNPTAARQSAQIEDRAVALSYSRRILPDDLATRLTTSGTRPALTSSSGAGNACDTCDTPFTQLTRPWRCRNCLCSVCDQCFQGQAVLPYPGLPETPIRVCTRCMHAIASRQEQRFSSRT